jgi:hypothetical protein
MAQGMVIRFGLGKPWVASCVGMTAYRGTVNLVGTRTRGVRAIRAYFLKRFSKAVRASMGLAEVGVDVSFSTRTRMEKNVH